MTGWALARQRKERAFQEGKQIGRQWAAGRASQVLWARGARSIALWLEVAPS